MTYSKGSYRRARRAALLAAIPLTLVAFPAAAQPVSRPVVQALPPPAASHLNDALRRLARNSQDFSALVDAGTASLALNDVDAAIGFFGRADELRPGDARVKAGLAAAYLRVDRAIEALDLFAQAERSGSIPPAFAADRGLAYDLVGDNAAAQRQYRAAIGRGADDEIVRRLALSQAIAGDRRGFEATLLPLLERRDLAAFRARAFGLAILGDEAEAQSIVKAVMPAELAQRIGPYLSYMPRLTPSQQAAAANLGQFPRAAQIGRDDPRLAQYTGGSAAARASDTRLAPSGEPLGPRRPVEDTRSQRRRPDRGSSTTERARMTREERLSRAQWARVSAPQAAAAPVTVTREPPAAAVRPVVAAPPPPPPPPAPAVELPPEPRPSTSIAAATPTPAAASTPASGFDLARVGASGTTQVQVELPPAIEEPSVAEAFADLTLTPAQAAAAQGAVDITAIEVPREVAKPPEAAKPPEPAKPLHPSRRWVQVATGKDLKALAFDWRRFGRKAPELLGERKAFTTPWGESRRLLTGPFDSDRAAQKMVTDLKAAGLDAFTFTSDAGQEIAPLK